MAFHVLIAVKKLLTHPLDPPMEETEFKEVGSGQGLSGSCAPGNFFDICFSVDCILSILNTCVTFQCYCYMCNVIFQQMQ